MPSTSSTAASQVDDAVTASLALDTVWLDKQKYEDAERQYHEHEQRQGQHQQAEESSATAATATTATAAAVAAVTTATPKTGKAPSVTKSRKQPKEPAVPKKQQQQHQDVENKDEKDVGVPAVSAETPVVTSKPQKQGKNKEKQRSKKTDNKPEPKDHQQQEPSSSASSSSSKVTGGRKKAAAAAVAVQDKSIDKPIGHQPPSGSAAKGQSQTKLDAKIAELEAETGRLDGVTEDLRTLVLKLEARVAALEKSPSATASRAQRTAAAAATTTTTTTTTPKKDEAKKDKTEVVVDDDDDDVDLFGSEEENDEEKELLHQERLKAYEAKKSKKPALVAKSNIILDIKPWDDETDMKEMEKQVRTIEMDGLIWGASKLVPLAYGIHKLQISCVVEDDKVSVDLLQEQIEAFDELVQSVDIAAFNKV